MGLCHAAEFRGTLICVVSSHLLNLLVTIIIICSSGCLVDLELARHDALKKKRLSVNYMRMISIKMFLLDHKIYLFHFQVK